jgi:hypothetical protein
VTFGNLLHLKRHGRTFFDRLFLEESEELLRVRVLVKTALLSFKSFLRLNGSTCMDITSHLHVSMPHVDKLTHFLVLRVLPIFPLTSPGTIHGGLACITVMELKSRRIHGLAGDAALV